MRYWCALTGCVHSNNLDTCTGNISRLICPMGVIEISSTLGSMALTVRTDSNYQVRTGRARAHSRPGSHSARIAIVTQGVVTLQARISSVLYDPNPALNYVVKSVTGACVFGCRVGPSYS